MAYFGRSRAGAFDPRDAVHPCWRCAILLRWQVHGSPSVASPFGREKRHWAKAVLSRFIWRLEQFVSMIGSECEREVI